MKTVYCDYNFIKIKDKDYRLCIISIREIMMGLLTIIQKKLYIYYLQFDHKLETLKLTTNLEPTTL